MAMVMMSERGIRWRVKTDVHVGCWYLGADRLAAV